MGKLDRDVRHIIIKNLRELMLEHELTQLALEKKSGVPQTSISLMQNCIKRDHWPGLENVEKIAKAFGLEMWEFIHPRRGRGVNDVTNDIVQAVIEQIDPLRRNIRGR